MSVLKECKSELIISDLRQLCCHNSIVSYLLPLTSYTLHSSHFLSIPNLSERLFKALLCHLVLLLLWSKCQNSLVWVILVSVRQVSVFT